MIIQDSKNNVSIPKEYMSIYNEGTQNFDAIPELPIQITEYIDPNTGVTKHKAIYTINDSIVDGSVNLYGAIYGVELFGDKYQVVLGAAVQEFISNPFYRLFGFVAYYFGTDSETGATKYFSDNMRRTMLATNDPLIIKNPNMIMTGSYPSVSSLTIGGGTYEAIFDFSDNIGYSSTFADKISAGTSKNTNTYNFYLDNTALKNDLAAKADSYTTINLYHRDGTPWS